MNPEILAKIAAKKAAGMNPEQAGDGLLMGVDMLAGRIDAFLQEQEILKDYPAHSLSLLISKYINQDEKLDVRYDVMRFFPENGTQGKHEHIYQCRATEILGIPDMFAFLVDAQMRKNILLSFNEMAEETGISEKDIQFHVVRADRPERHNLKLLLLQNGQSVLEINLEETIKTAVGKGEFNTQNDGNSNK